MLVIEDKPFRLDGPDQSIFIHVNRATSVYLRREKIFVQPTVSAREALEHGTRIYLTQEQIDQVNETGDYDV